MTWTEDQFSVHAPREVWESFVDHNVVAAMMIGVFVICMGYPLTHRMYVRYCRPYRALSREQQLVVIQHTIEAVMLSLLFAPLTYLLLSISFEEQEDLESFHKKVSAIGSLMFIIIIMYMVELATRYENPRALVVAHHICAYANALFPALYLTTGNVRSASVLVYMICYEAVSFWGLLMYRLYPNHKWTPRVILSGIYIVGLSRPVQVVWILASLISTWEHLVVWVAVVQIILVCLFTSLQLYSLSIHWNMRVKCLAERNNKEDNTPTHGGSEEANPTQARTIVADGADGLSRSSFDVVSLESNPEEGSLRHDGDDEIMLQG